MSQLRPSLLVAFLLAALFMVASQGEAYPTSSSPDVCYTASCPANLNRPSVLTSAPNPSDNGYSFSDGEKVSLKIKYTSLRETLRRIFLMSGEEYSVDSNVPNIPVFLDLHEVTARQAMHAVVSYIRERVTGFGVRGEGILIFQINRRNRQVAATALVLPHRKSLRNEYSNQNKFDIALKEIPLREGLAWLMQGLPEEYNVHANVPDILINLELHNVTLKEAVRAFLRSARVTIPGIGMCRKSGVRIFSIR